MVPMNPDAVAAAVATGKLHASASSQDDVWAAQLEAAVASGSVRAVRALLAEQPRGSDSADPDLLLFACEQGHAAVVECLVRDAGLTPSCASPLHLAAKNGHNAVVHALLEAGAAPGAADKLGLTALHRASERGHTDIVRALLDAKASAGAARDNGTTPMYLAARDGHAAIVTLLLEHGADADASMMPVRNAEAGITPLYAAAGRGHAETASLLLAAGAQVDRTNTLGTTALFVACSNGYADAALVLLEARAQPDLPGGRNGSRPLLAATERGHMRCVSLLIEAHADPTWYPRPPPPPRPAPRPEHAAHSTYSTWCSTYLLYLRRRYASGKTALELGCRILVSQRKSGAPGEPRHLRLAPLAPRAHGHKLTLTLTLTSERGHGRDHTAAAHGDAAVLRHPGRLRPAASRRHHSRRRHTRRRACRRARRLRGDRAFRGSESVQGRRPRRRAR